MRRLNLTGYNTEIQFGPLRLFFKYLQAMAFLTLKREISPEKGKMLWWLNTSTLAAGGGMVVA